MKIPKEVKNWLSFSWKIIFILFMSYAIGKFLAYLFRLVNCLSIQQVILICLIVGMIIKFIQRKEKW